MDLADVSDGESNTVAAGETLTEQGWALPGAGTFDSPPNGGGPGSDLAFMAAQHLDPNNVALGILNPLGAGHGADPAHREPVVCTRT